LFFKLDYILVLLWSLGLPFGPPSWRCWASYTETMFLYLHSWMRMTNHGRCSSTLTSRGVPIWFSITYSWPAVASNLWLLFLGPFGCELPKIIPEKLSYKKLTRLSTCSERPSVAYHWAAWSKDWPKVLIGHLVKFICVLLINTLMFTISTYEIKM